jgi:putative transposase
MRKARIKATGAGYYHGMSRVIERRHIFGPTEKTIFCNLMHNLAAFGGLKILTYALMDNHFHILVYVPERHDITDAEFFERLGHIYSSKKVAKLRGQLAKFQHTGQLSAAEALKNRYAYRMHDISEFFKALKQRFSQYYNRREKRSGPLWEQRFKSILLDGYAHVLGTVAAYIDLNPVRAGLSRDPKDYPFSGYGAAVAGNTAARGGLRQLLELSAGANGSWGHVQQAYTARLFTQTESTTRTKGFVSRPFLHAVSVTAARFDPTEPKGREETDP